MAPLGIPLIAGPGAITTIIVLSDDATGAGQTGLLFGVLAVIMLITLASFLGVELLGRFMGENGQRIFMRVVGLIEMAFAVEFFFQGLTPIVQRML